MSKTTSNSNSTQNHDYKLWQLIRSDIQRWNSNKEALLKLGFYSALFHRLSHYFSQRNLLFIAGSIQLFSQIFTGAEISHRAKIGQGLCFLHPVGVHIGPGIKIGKNATICECSSVIYMEEENPPVIGDFLWLGPGARVIGDVTLGDEVRVGPNSVVLKNISSQKTAFGLPAREIPKEFSPNNTYNK